MLSDPIVSRATGERSLIIGRAVSLPGLPSAEGTGGSKRVAEKAAASAMLASEGVKGSGDGGS